MDNHHPFKRTGTKPHLHYRPQSSPPRPRPASSQAPRLIRHTMSAKRPYKSRYDPSRPGPMLPHRYERRIFGRPREDGYRGRIMGGIGEMNGRWERDGYRGSIKRNGSEMEERTLSDGLFSEPNECRIIGSGEVDGYQGRMGGTSARNNQSERDGYRGSIKRDSSEMEDLIFPDGRILESIEVYEGMTMGSKADWERAAESSKRHRTSSIRSGAAPNTRLIRRQNKELSRLQRGATSTKLDDIELLKGPALRAHLARYSWQTSSHTRSSRVSFDEAVASRCSPLDTSILNSPFVPDMEEGDDGDASSCTLRNETPSPRSQSSYNAESLEQSIDFSTPESESKFPYNIERLEQSIESSPESQRHFGYNVVELEQWVPSPSTQRRIDERLYTQSPSLKIQNSPEQSPTNSWVEVPCTSTSSPKIQSSPEQSPSVTDDSRFQAAFETWMTQYGKAIVEAAVKEAVKEMMGEMMGKEDVKTELRYEDVAVVEDSQGYTDDDEL